MHSATPDAGELFLRAEQAGLKLAIVGRIGALVLMGVWLIGTRADDPARALGYVLVLSIFAALGRPTTFPPPRRRRCPRRSSSPSAPSLCAASPSR